jgi:hypothetical protein
MAIEKFIPEIWAKQFEKDLEKDLVFYENCNHQYEGLATKPGDTVKILGLGKPNLRSFGDGKLHKLDEPEAIEDLSMTLPIMQVRDFNFYVDDLEKRQAEGGSGLLSEYMSQAKEEVAASQDAYIAKLVTSKQVKKETVTSALTKDNILDVIDTALLTLLNNDVKRTTEITLTAPPWFVMLMKKAYVDLDTNNSEMMKNGRVGRYSGLIIKESTNVYNDGTYDNIQIKTNRAISFVKPYLHLEAYKPESYFSDAVKGYALFDGKVTRPKEIVNLQVKQK